VAEETEAPKEATPPAITDDGRVRVQAPDGSYGTIPLAKAAAAEEHGYHIEGAQEYEARKYEEHAGALGGAKAFGENALSSGTLGLSDVAAGALGGNEYRQNRALRELAYPTASTAGEVAGMVLPALIPGGAEAEAAEGLAHGAQAAEALGGASLLGRAAEAGGAVLRNSPAGLALRGGEAASELTGHALQGLGLGGEGLLSRVASSGLKAAAGGATEGAAFGAGGALSEAALAPDGDYDSLAQKLWAGAIHGAEFGATVGGGLGIGGELAGAAARKIGGTFSARRALNELSDAKTLKSAGYLGSDIAKVSQANPGRIHELAETVRGEDSIGWLDTLKDRAKKLSDAKNEAGNTLGTMRKGLDEARGVGEGVDIRGVIGKARERLIDLRTNAVTSADDKIVTKFSRELKRMSDSFGEGEPASFEAAHDLRRKLDDELTNYGRRTYPASGSKRPPDGFERQLMQLRTDLEGEFENSAERVMGKTTPEFRTQYTDAKSRYGALKEISTVSKKRVGMAAGNRDISLTDTMAGLTGFATMGPAGILAAAANRAIRSSQADHIVGKLASELAKLDQHVEGAAARWAGKSRRAARGTEAVLEAPPVPHAAVAGHSALKEALEHGAEVGKVTTSSTLHVRSEAAEQRERVEEYYHKLRGAEAEANAPEGTLVSIPDAPETQKAAEKVRRIAAAWLMKEAPVSPATVEHPMLARIARQMKPNPVEVLSWMRKVRTVENPLVAVKAFEEGRLTRDHVDALKATNPAVLNKLRNEVVAQVTDTHADISYKDRIQLGVLLDVEADPTLRPASISLAQETYRNMKNSGAGPGGTGGGQPPGPSAPGRMPKGTASRVDALEEGQGI
jgi:hypothetical protein